MEKNHIENSDQSKFSRGVREVNHEKEDAKFIEAEMEPNFRRDPEESRYNEAGQPVVIQAEEEKDA